MSIKRNWIVEYYLYNLTEKVEKRFFTRWGAFIYAWYIARHFGYKAYIDYQSGSNC